MPAINLPQTNFGSQEEIADGLIATNRMLTYLMYNLDDDNVKELSADKLTAGTIDASLITVDNIDASNINTGTLNASVVNVTNINASNIETGTLSAIDIDGVNIYGSRYYDEDGDGYLDIQPALGGGVTDFIFSNGSNDIFTVYDDLSNVAFKTYGNTFMYMGNTGNVYAVGNWNFSLATVSGLTAVFA